MAHGETRAAFRDSDAIGHAKSVIGQWWSRAALPFRYLPITAAT